METNREIYVLVSETVAGKDLPDLSILTVDSEAIEQITKLEYLDTEGLADVLGLEFNMSILGWTENIDEVREVFPNFVPEQK